MASRRLSGVGQRFAWAAAVGAFLIAVAVIFFQNEAFYRDFQDYISLSVPPASPPRARLTIDFGNGQKRAFEGQANAGMTALAALRVSQAAGGFEAVTSQRGEVVRIADVANSAAKRWRIYVNGTPTADLPGHTEIQPGDRITFRYE